MRRLAVVAVALAAVAVMAGCEPSMTITAKNRGGSLISCHDSAHVVGVVSPHNATGAVQLQRSAGGKWTDVKGFGSYSAWSWQLNPGATQASPRRAAVNQSTGAYTINYYVDGAPDETPVHLRVRSNGGGSFSPGFYVSNEFC